MTWHTDFVRSETPLPTRPWPPLARGQDNLTGFMFGRLTVIGLAAEKTKSSAGAAWVVRCTCGTYEHRRTAFLRRGNSRRAMCSECDRAEQTEEGTTP